MKCSNCGKVVRKGTNYCPDCGSKIEEENIDMVEELIAEEDNKDKATLKDSEALVQNPIKKRTNKLGLAGFIVSLCGLCSRSITALIVGLCLSAVALNSHDENTQKGKGFAIAGLTIGIVGLVIYGIYKLVRLIRFGIWW